MRRALYWLAVLAVSLALVVGLILLLESRDASELEEASAPGWRAGPAATVGALPARVAGPVTPARRP